MQWWNTAWGTAMPWPMFLPMLWPIVMIGGITGLVMLVMRGRRTDIPPTWQHDARRQTPFEILGERFARGEIDRHEYEERKELLSQP
jgi:putative membrane protein